jgi:Flp pilus assembly protein TadG
LIATVSHALRRCIASSNAWTKIIVCRLPLPANACIVPVKQRAKPALGEHGATLVELAVSLPVLLTFVFGLIQVSIAMYTRSAISESAREGTRYAMVHGASCLTAGSASCTLSAANINTYVSSNSMPNLGGGSQTVNTTYPDGNQNRGSRVQVTVAYAFPFRVPYIPASTLTMSSTSVMYITQ